MSKLCRIYHLPLHFVLYNTGEINYFDPDLRICNTYIYSHKYIHI